ncbi:MAG: hypothetical protein ACOZE5_14445 [Verrucomicrobiota bacterium]
MSGLKPKYPDRDSSRPLNPGCLDTRDIPAVCLRLESHRQRIAIPYALLLKVEISTDETACELTFATHQVSIRGRHLHDVYLAVSQAQAVQISTGLASGVPEGRPFVGPLITEIRIEPVDERDRTRQ